MLPDRVSNPGPLTYESGALPIALRGPALPSLAKSIPEGIIPLPSLAKSIPEGIIPLPSLAKSIPEGIIPLPSLAKSIPKGIIN